MFSSSRRSQYDSFSKHRAGKSSSGKAKRSFREASLSRRVDRMDISPQSQSSPGGSPHLTSAIITICVGREQRLFAAHEDVLTHSPFFASLARNQFFESSGKRIDLPDEEPLVLSSILEYLYKGDYFPRLEYDKRSRAFQLEDAGSAAGSPGGPNAPAGAENTVWVTAVGGPILKDTMIYCAAERYGLPELKKLALRKQGLQTAVQCGTILTSARYAYAHTPDSDSRLRAHYLALIIRSRHTFKRSGTMQNEMEAGGRLFFDLFVAMSNHMDDITSARSPR